MLEIRHLEKSFGNKQVLFGVDLTAQQGAYPWFGWEKWGRKNHHFPQHPALFGLQR